MTEIDITRRQALAGAAAAGGYVVLGRPSKTSGGITLSETNPRAEALRPVVGGTWISPAATDGYGTLGVAGDYNGEPVALTNRHVVDEGSDDDPADVVGTTVNQPETEAIGDVIEASDVGGKGSEDWALIGLDVDRTTRTIAANVGAAGSVAAGDRVVIAGARTGLIGATVERTSVDTNFRGELYSGLIEYRVDEDRDTGGNSGSLVGKLENGTLSPIGLHTFGIDEWRYAIPWGSVPADFDPTVSGAEPPTPDAGGWVEAVITGSGTDTVTVHAANLGGASTTATVTAATTDGTDLDSADVTLGALETTTLTLSVGDETDIQLTTDETDILTKL